MDIVWVFHVTGGRRLEYWKHTSVEQDMRLYFGNEQRSFEPFILKLGVF